MASHFVTTFAVVIPAYQAAESIGECVESALAQTTPAREVIVVDDGSTDDTAARLARFGDRITYVRQENRGKAGAVNRATEMVSSDFLSILDADDVYEPERLAALTDLARRRPDLDILMTDAYLESEGRVVGRFTDWTPFRDHEQSVAIFEDCFVAWPAVRRRALVTHGGFDESLRVGSDWECWIRLLHAGCVAGMVDEPLVRYRIRNDSLTGDRLAALRARVEVLERAALLDLTSEERQALERFLARRKRRLLVAETEHALREREPGARRRSAKVAFAPGMPPSTRLLALAAAAAPRAAARRLARIEARTGYSRTTRLAPTKPTGSS
jgi:Glycosyl transferase family 2